MHGFILWCGFLGGWLLVAGPVYQAALELSDEDVRREHIAAAARRYTPPPAHSPWWWLLPPVGYWLQRRRSQRIHREVLDLATPEQVEAFIQLANKATGWIMVAAGGTLIASKETWELVEHNEWPTWVFWLLVVVMFALSASYTSARLSRAQALLKKPAPAQEARAGD